MPRRNYTDDDMTSVDLPGDFSLDIAGGEPLTLEPPIWPELPTFDTQQIVEAGKQLDATLRSPEFKDRQQKRRQERNKKLAEKGLDARGKPIIPEPF